ncbi:iron-containing alcohol dehydrogenase [Bifidobacterium aquikefiri]|uniref:iron-containing alcohol dehydrogenase n=2 Tax=Bifidobacterium aquikefiri TaxID=1653207 RepID=UPI0023F12531|nr:iron-containing alcohol dehydrogenase [Bifidobacterium aquikefiri]
MQDFEFHEPTRTIFGRDALDQLSKVLLQLRVHSILAVSGVTYPEELGIQAKVTAVCDEQGIDLIWSDEVRPNPRLELVHQLVDTAREHNVDLVIAVGGGSSIDTAKTIALGVPYEHDVWDFFQRKAVPVTALPIGVISTIPGSGSEQSDCAVIQEGRNKVFFENPLILPNFTIINPEFSRSVPTVYQSSAIADMTAHLLEVYATDEAPVDVTDRLIEASFTSVLIYGRKVIRDPQDVAVRSELHMLSAVTHNDGILGKGRIPDWVGHKIEHEISGLFGLIHGEGMSVVTPAWMRFVAARKPDKLVQFATRVFHIDAVSWTDAEIVEIAAAELEAFYRELGLHTRLSEHGISRTDLEDIAFRATQDGSILLGNYLQLNTADVVELLEYAL